MNVAGAGSDSSVAMDRRLRDRCRSHFGSQASYPLIPSSRSCDNDADESPSRRGATRSGLVFTSTVGTVLEPRNLTRLFDRLIARAGVRRIRFRDLRHTCASLLLAQNVPPRVVMEVLGHSQIAITMNLYAHVMPPALREAADATDRALR